MSQYKEPKLTTVSERENRYLGQFTLTGKFSDRLQIPIAASESIHSPCLTLHTHIRPQQRRKMLLFIPTVQAAKYKTGKQSKTRLDWEMLKASSVAGRERKDHAPWDQADTSNKGKTQARQRTAKRAPPGTMPEPQA